MDVTLCYLPKQIQDYIDEYGLELNPDFQRGHVWSAEQEQKYIEFILSGGTSARDFYFNHPGWMDDFEGDFVCVDGLQRITALLRFMDDKITVFGGYFASEIDGLRSPSLCLRIHVNSLKSRNDVLRWYIQFNAGGTPHSKDEISRVQSMITDNLKN